MKRDIFYELVDRPTLMPSACSEGLRNFAALQILAIFVQNMGRGES